MLMKKHIGLITSDMQLYMLSKQLGAIVHTV